MSAISQRPVWRPSRRQVLAGAGSVAGLAALPRASRAAGEPIKIGIIAEMATLDGAAIPKGAQMAVDAINARGGVMGRPLRLIVYDNHSSAPEATSTFQRLSSSDKVAAVLGVFASETVLALEPWAARLKLPFITPAAASNRIAQQVHDDYDRFKYAFQGWLNAYFIAESIADSARDLLVDQLHMKSAVLMSENADWSVSYDAAMLEFLPKAGLEVLDHIRFAPDTSDYTPIFDRIEAKKPDVIVTGMGHAGVVPTVQWAEAEIPIPMYGESVQATSSAFWKDTHGAAEGITSQTGAAPDSAITALTLPFTRDYEKRYGLLPAYCGYTSYDMIYILAAAIERMKSTDADQLVTGLEATDYLGTIGRFKFYGRNDPFTHALEYGPDLVSGVMMQWQNARMKTIWPLKYATAKISFPSFVKLPA